MSLTPARLPVLAVSGLTTVFDTAAGRVCAADQVTLELAAGETLGLVGESGCGKSITALSIVGLVPPPGRVAHGSIRLDGRELAGLRDAELRRIRGAEIGFVFQDPMAALNPVLTAGAQLIEALVVHHRASRADARLAALDLLAAVRLPDPRRHLGEFPHQLSGGMRQRLLIAMALACGPRLLIADEPTTALDVTIQADVIDLLREHRDARGLALLIIAHDLGVVAQVADRVAVMYAGRIVESAPVARLFEAPRHPYSQGLLASALGVVTGRRLTSIAGTAPNLAVLPRGCAFAPRCPWRFAPCDLAPPPDTWPAPGESVRCYLWGDDRAGMRPASTAKTTAGTPAVGGGASTSGPRPSADEAR